MTISRERGYLIPAVNTDDIDYESLAHRLADSIRRWHPSADITIVTRDMLSDPSVKGWAIDSQMWNISPYRQTIKLEADMLAAGPIDHWWTMFEKRDLVISTGARDIYDRTSNNRYYRKIFDVNNLPDVYNAITYWRVSRLAQDFFRWVKVIFDDWGTYKHLLKFPDDIPSTDLVYAMAAVIIGPELITQPWSSYPKIVHMKQQILGTKVADWTQQMIWERDDKQLRINTVAQTGLVHYHIKTWNPDGQQ